MESEEQSARQWATRTTGGTSTNSDKPLIQTEVDQDAILATLSDMFGEVLSPDNISTVCNLFKWKMEDCIDALIRLNSEEERIVPGASLDIPTSIENQQILGYCSESVTSEQVNVFDMESGNRNLGAIPKWAFKTNNSVPQRRPMNRQQLSSMPQRSQPSAGTKKQLDPLLNKIRMGYKIMVLMRGAPGSGKSHLAKDIVQATIPEFDYRNHIFSTDDYFYDRNGNYVFRIDELSPAHDWNRRRVCAQAMNGWAPIIVDNTNIKVWEMFDYVKIAVDYGYLVEIVEPRTHWSKSAGKLAVKNRHGVAKEKIQRMLDSYERTTVAQLFQATNSKYNAPVPQFRLLPSIIQHAPPSIPATFCEVDSVPTVSETDDDNGTSVNDAERIDDEVSDDVFSTEVPDNWTSYEKESKDYWRAQQIEGNLQDVISTLPKPPRRERPKKESAKNEKRMEERIVEEWRAEIMRTSNTQSSEKDAGESIVQIERHVVGCENENTTFTTLRQIYPNKEVDGLWELFEKCQGNIDWVIDILLKDDSCVNQQSDEPIDSAFNCNCTFGPWEEETTDCNQGQKVSDEINDPASPKRQRLKRDKITNRNPEEMESIRKSIEKQFVLGDQHYSQRTKRIRDLRHGVSNTTEEVAVSNEQPTECDDATTIGESKDNDDESSDHEDDEIVEIFLGDTMIDQLSNMFEVDLIPKNMIKDLKSNVFIPKSLAYQLYLIWVESVYNQVEEQKFKTLRDDEELAKMLALQEIKKTTDVKTLGEELVTKFYSKEQNSWDSNGQDLASHLTKLKLSEQFPNIGQQTLLETFGTLDNCYQDTVQILQDTFPNQSVGPAPYEDNTPKVNTTVDADSEKANLDLVFATGNNLNNDDEKKLALHNFETNRNMAVHHSQLKAECYQKAKEAIQKGNTAVAVYYSQIADLHKQKVDSYNHSAANCIVVVHDITQNNPDFIDLHYLHQVEAEQCLDVFIDKHIRKLRSVNKAYKYIFIITGRGLHSTGGVSIIKNRVKSRLKDRNLKWTELNPGLLKVKVFSTSKFTNKVSMC